MSRPVGVLAVIDAAYTALYSAAEDEAGQALAETVLQTITAVAELIRLAEMADESLNRNGISLSEGGSGRTLTAAIARVKGGAA